MTNTAGPARAAILLVVAWVSVAGCRVPREAPTPGSLDAAGGRAGAGPAGGAGGGSPGTGGGSPLGGAGGSGTSPDDAGTQPGEDAPGGSPGDAGGLACVVGTTRCAAMGPVVEVCTVGGQWVMDKLCPAICEAGACAGRCAPGERQCGSGQTPEICSAEGEWNRDSKPCEFVCLGKGECGGECLPGATKCGEAPVQLTPYTCDEKGKWVAGTPCPNLCSNGSCGGSCRPGALRCSNGRKETCSQMGTWEPTETCRFVCTGEGACTGECKPGARRCAGQVIETCDDQGLWRAGSSCGGKACVNGACVGACTPGATSCGPNHTPQRCNEMGVQVPGQPCPYVCLGNGQCGGQCRPNSRSCSGTEALICSGDGLSLTRMDCGRGAPAGAQVSCTGSGNCQARCPRQTCGNQCCDCASTADCGGNEICTGNRCQACPNGRCGSACCQCNDNGDCGASGICTGNRCQSCPNGRCGSACCQCNSDNDCGNRICRDNRCVDRPVATIASMYYIATAHPMKDQVCPGAFDLPCNARRDLAPAHCIGKESCMMKLAWSTPNGGNGHLGMDPCEFIVKVVTLHWRCSDGFQDSTTFRPTSMAQCDPNNSPTRTVACR